jgi:hypothetical protein
MLCHKLFLGLPLGEGEDASPVGVKKALLLEFAERGLKFLSSSWQRRRSGLSPVRL